MVQNNSTEIKELSEVLPKLELTLLRDLLDQTFIIYSIREVNTRFGKKLVMNVETMDGEILDVLVTGQVVTDQLRAIEEHLPVKATLVKEQRYYELR